ncbi:hypothetical protein AYK26_02270 [Euryarchaeota archaeon SM23-78]|nr:MAG: hypothetical protein AYK26_02270 [Euryarchaeota archaeon SM23-78]MBW3001245.1 sulfatase-like hydrolase/transferase [Candidatus Woesearchaeota archaeon]
MKQTNKPNIIIFLVDAMRAQSVSCYGFHLKTTPNIDKLAREGIRFENAFTSINTTDASITSIMTGKHPTRHGIHNQAEKVTKTEISTFFARKNQMLQSILKEQSYHTFGLDWLGRWHKTGYDYYLKITEIKEKKMFFQNLEKMLSKIKPLHKLMVRLYFSEKLNWLTNKFKPYSDGLELAKKAESIIKNNKNHPFFMFIHFWDTHAPYNCSSALQKKFFEKNQPFIPMKHLINQLKDKEVRSFYEALTGYQNDARQVIARYHASINYCDEMIGRITTSLRQKKILDNTIIFITADHGESLVEHNILFDHHGLYEQNLKIPLIIRYPKLGKGKVVKNLAMNLDITPTVIDILGIRKRFDKDNGKSLVKLMQGKEKRKYVFAEENYLQKKRCIRSERYKYIFPQKGFRKCKRCGYVHGEVEELYDLKKDPKEVKNIVKKNPAVAKALRKEAGKFFKEDINEKEKIVFVVDEIRI